MHKLLRYLGALSLAVNQLGNAVLGGNPEMTISARAGLARERGRRAGTIACALLRVVPARLDDPYDGLGPAGDHCDVAVRNWTNRIR